MRHLLIAGDILIAGHNLSVRHNSICYRSKQNTFGETCEKFWESKLKVRCQPIWVKKLARESQRGGSKLTDLWKSCENLVSFQVKIYCKNSTKRQNSGVTTVSFIDMTVQLPFRGEMYRASWTLARSPMDLQTLLQGKTSRTPRTFVWCRASSYLFLCKFFTKFPILFVGVA